MKSRYIKLFVIGILMVSSNNLVASDTSTIGSTQVVIDTVYYGLDVPWELLYGYDHKLWLTERYGMISRIDLVTNEKEILLNLSSSVYSSGESGLLAMAFHPEFPSVPEVFIVYTYFTGGVKERLVKYQYDGDSLINPSILINQIPGNTTHIGSRLLFLSDGTLLMSTGDAQQKTQSQDQTKLNGKILRLHSDGSVPTDNPSNSYMWAYGLRNTQGLCLGPNNQVYASEHGPSTNDEFQMIIKAQNYGWPNVEGFCDLPGEIAFCDTQDVQEPLLAWTPTIAPSDIVYYNHPNIPEWQGSVLLGLLKNKRVIALKLNNSGDTVLQQDHYFINKFGRIRDICLGPNGSVYLATNGPDWANSQPNTHCIIRIRALNAASDISEFRLPEPKIIISPNPAVDIVLVSTSKGKPHQINVYNHNGRLVLSARNTDQVSLKDLESGLYNFEVYCQDHIYKVKVIKKE